MALRDLTEDPQTGRLTLQESASYRVVGFMQMIGGGVLLWFGLAVGRKDAAAFLLSLFFGLAFFCIGTYLAFNTDTLVVDPQSKKLVSFNQFLFYQSASKELSFSEMASVEVKFYIQSSGRSGGHQAWKVVVTDRSGARWLVNQDGGRDEMLDLGRKVAAMAHVPLLDHSHTGQSILDKILGREGDAQPPDTAPAVQPAESESYAAPPEPPSDSAEDRPDSSAETSPIPTSPATPQAAPAFAVPAAGETPGNRTAVVVLAAFGGLLVAGVLAVVAAAILSSSSSSRAFTAFLEPAFPSPTSTATPSATPTYLLQALMDSQHETAQAMLAKVGTSTWPEEGTLAAPAVPTAFYTATAAALEQAPLFFSDDFQNNANGWAVDPVDDNYGTASRSIGDGLYKWSVSSKAGDTIYRSGPPNMIPISDYTYSVQCQRINGSTDVNCGMMFRYDRGNYYLFEINDDQEYSFYVRSDGAMRTLIAASHSSAIAVGEANRLKVTAAGPHLSLYVNDQRVGEIDDSTLTRGIIGVVLHVRNVGDQGTYQFQHVEVRSPEGTAPTATPSVPATRTPPPNATPGPFDGDWSGKSSTGDPVRFTILDNRLDHVNFSYFVRPQSICSVTGTRTDSFDDVPVAGSSFSVAIPVAAAPYTVTLAGTFQSRTQARGTVWIKGRTGCGDADSQATWTAAISPTVSSPTPTLYPVLFSDEFDSNPTNPSRRMRDWSAARPPASTD